MLTAIHCLFYFTLLYFTLLTWRFGVGYGVGRVNKVTLYVEPG